MIRNSNTLTILCQIGAAKLSHSNKLFPQLTITVHKHCRQILVWVVWNANWRDTFQKLGCRELGCQFTEEVFKQLAWWNTTCTHTHTFIHGSWTVTVEQSTYSPTWQWVWLNFLEFPQSLKMHLFCWRLCCLVTTAFSASYNIFLSNQINQPTKSRYPYICTYRYCNLSSSHIFCFAKWQTVSLFSDPHNSFTMELPELMPSSLVHNAGGIRIFRLLF